MTNLSRFLTSVYFSCRSFRRKTWLIVLCGLYGLFILIPLIFGNSRRTMAEILTADFPHLLLYINPAVIYVGLSAFSKRTLPTRPDSTSPLSLAGLASQATVHGIMTVSWALMVRPRLNHLTQVWPALIISYNFFWWPLVDNAIFVVLQGRLLWIALRGNKVISSEGQYEV